jgi:hypothetical protein
MNGKKPYSNYYMHKKNYLQLNTISKKLVGGDHIDEKNDIVIMQFNMLANGLMDDFLNKKSMKGITKSLKDLRVPFQTLTTKITESFTSNKNNYDKCLKENSEKKQINEIWTNIQSCLLGKTTNFKPDNYKEIYKCNEPDLNVIRSIITSFAKNFANDYEKMMETGNEFKNINEFPKSSYYTMGKQLESDDDLKITHMETYLKLRYIAFKKMVGKYNPAIICLQEDDYDNYIKGKDEYNSLKLINYEYISQKKLDSNAKKFITGKFPNKWYNTNFIENHKNYATDDGVSILFRNDIFEYLHTYEGYTSPGSPILSVLLRNINSEELFLITTTHIESGRDTYEKEKVRMYDIMDRITIPIDKIENKQIKKDYIKNIKHYNDEHFNNDEIKKLEKLISATNPDNRNYLFYGVVPFINSALKSINEDHPNNKINQILTGDFNTPFLDRDRFIKYYVEESENKIKTPSNINDSRILIDKKPIIQESAMYTLMEGLQYTQENVAVDNPTQMYSVNRIRGPTSAQLTKIYEDEYHDIDHVFYSSDSEIYTLLKTKLPYMIDKHYSTLLPNFEIEKQGQTIIESKVDGKSTNETWRNISINKENETYFINPYTNNNKNESDFISISDHLPLLVVLQSKSIEEAERKRKEEEKAATEKAASAEKAAAEKATAEKAAAEKATAEKAAADKAAFERQAAAVYSASVARHAAEKAAAEKAAAEKAAEEKAAAERQAEEKIAAEKAAAEKVAAEKAVAEKAAAEKAAAEKAAAEKAAAEKLATEKQVAEIQVATENVKEKRKEEEIIYC